MQLMLLNTTPVKQLTMVGLVKTPIFNRTSHQLKVHLPVIFPWVHFAHELQLLRIRGVRYPSQEGWGSLTCFFWAVLTTHLKRYALPPPPPSTSTFPPNFHTFFFLAFCCRQPAKWRKSNNSPMRSFCSLPFPRNPIFPFGKKNTATCGQRCS